MIGVIVTLRSDDRLDRGAVMGIAEQAGPVFDGMPGLRSKVFMFDPESGVATNTYVWESEAAARAFFTTEQIVSLYGVQPEIRFVEVAALIDNGVAATA
jgi:hypothetical protein